MYEGFQPYPSVRYHRDGSTKTIHSDEEHEALHAEGWRDTTAAFAADGESDAASDASDKKTSKRKK